MRPPPFAVAGRVRIARLVGVLVMHAMHSDPVDRAALQGMVPQIAMTYSSHLGVVKPR